METRRNWRCNTIRKSSSMASSGLLLLGLIAFSIWSLNFQPVKSGNVQMPAFAFSWFNDNDTFMAGDTAIIKVIVLGRLDFENYEFPFKPNITVNDKMGNSSSVTGVALHLDGATENWTISFIPIMVGLFNVLITDEHFRVLDSSMHFQVSAGQIYPAAGVLSWEDELSEFTAGSKSEVLILPKDAYGNNVSSSREGEFVHNFTLSASKLDGSPASILDITNKGWNTQGYFNIEFTAATAGNLLLRVQVENQTLHGSPLPFKVNPGELDAHNCIAELNVETKYFQLFSVMEGFIYQHDHYGNRVPGFKSFEIEILEKGTNLSMPVPDLFLKEISAGMQSFTFSLYEPGNFVLMISDLEKNTLISGMPFEFTVFIGYCDGEKSIVNGTGLNNSVAGDTANLSIFLKDAYLYPSPVELESLQIQIVHISDSKFIHPIIQVRDNPNGSFSFGRLNYGTGDLKGYASAPFVAPISNFSGNRSRKGSDFDAVYVPEKSGLYEIRVFCGNILLNSGHPFEKEVIPGVVNFSLSGVTRFAQRAPKLTDNEIIVELLDSYHNPVLKQQSKLKLEIASVNQSGFSTSLFSDNNDGSYTATYTAKDIGTYEMCVSYNGDRFIPCPFGANIYNSEYFPMVYNDMVSVWEDESVAFDVLENDYFAGGNANIVEYSKPVHGSLLRHGRLFRYTPYKGFYGNDSFSYTISDVNGNLASGPVDLLILCRPPLFVSILGELQATEDKVSPKFSGFSGFEILYSDSDENISVTLSSEFGILMLSPMQMQFWQPKWNELSVQIDVEMAKKLTLVGSLDAINYALQSIQYLGNDNFYGSDVIRVSTMNLNGRNDVDIPISVQPINDFPVINVPSFVTLDYSSDGAIIFRKRNDKVDFIHDPDLPHFPGNRSGFLIVFAVEVSDGLLSASLPADLINTTEVKLKNNYHWQPVQTFVTISKHFMVKAKGIRFRGSIEDCNNIMQQLSYHNVASPEGKQGTVLTVKVNDLGNHGCYPDCTEMMAMSLFADSTVNLIPHRHMSSLVAHALGSAIIIESIVVFSLGLVLLFFLCKCTVVLVHEKKQKASQDIELSKLDSKGNQVGARSYVNRKLSACCCPLPLSIKDQNSISKRSRLISGNEEAGNNQIKPYSQSSSDHYEDASPSNIKLM